MKWNTPKLWDVRTRTRFAFLPHECSDGKTRWLERVVVADVFIGAFFFFDGWWNVWSGSMAQAAARKGTTQAEMNDAAFAVGRLKTLRGGGYQPISPPSVG